MRRLLFRLYFLQIIELDLYLYPTLEDAQTFFFPTHPLEHILQPRLIEVEMNQWEHLFYGEYAEREKILSQLTLEQVTAVPSGQSHSIFAELWHTVVWQKIIVTRDETLYNKTWQENNLYPKHVPKKLEEWTALVEEFLLGYLISGDDQPR